MKLILCGTLVFLVLGYGSQDVAAASRSGVFYTQETEKGCSWQLVDPQTQEKRSLYRTSTCPSEIIWNTKQRETIYSDGNTPQAAIFQVSWQGQDKPRMLGPRGDLVDLWLSQDTGRLRRASIVETTSKNTVSDKGTSYFVYRGVRYPTETLVADGMPAMAVVEELTDKGWTVIGAKSTTWGAGDAMGTLVVKDWMKQDPQSVTLQKLLQDVTCAVQDCENQDSKIPEAVKARIETLFPKQEAGRNSAAYKAVNATEGVLFATVLGDTLHAAGPVYYCRDHGQNIERLGPSFEFSQMSISTQGACALITEEYTGNEASILCVGRSESPLVLKKSHSAV